MKMIKPIVNLSKIVDDYDTVVFGLYGTLFDGQIFSEEVKGLLERLYKSGKKIIVLSNTSKRVAEIVDIVKSNDINLAWFYSIITAGEILHYKLKAKKCLFASIGSKYYAIGKENGVFDNLDYEQVSDIAKADFLYVGQNFNIGVNVEDYKQDMSFAISLNIPFVCAGNNVSNYKGGVVEIDSGAFAEQYATLGGQILTTGKPDADILSYVLDGINLDKVLFVGSSMQVDIKMANILGIDSVLVSKGIHKHFLGEGYIPDVAKTRELAVSFNVYPDYVISSPRY